MSFAAYSGIHSAKKATMNSQSIEKSSKISFFNRQPKQNRFVSTIIPTKYISQKINAFKFLNTNTNKI